MFPITRKEKIMARAAGQDVPALAPLTREEFFLNEITEHIDAAINHADSEIIKVERVNGEIELTADEMEKILAGTPVVVTEYHATADGDRGVEVIRFVVLPMNVVSNEHVDGPDQHIDMTCTIIAENKICFTMYAVIHWPTGRPEQISMTFSEEPDNFNGLSIVNMPNDIFPGYTPLSINLTEDILTCASIALNNGHYARGRDMTSSERTTFDAELSAIYAAGSLPVLLAKDPSNNDVTFYPTNTGGTLTFTGSYVVTVPDVDTYIINATIFLDSYENRLSIFIERRQFNGNEPVENDSPK